MQPRLRRIFADFAQAIHRRERRLAGERQHVTRVRLRLDRLGVVAAFVDHVADVTEQSVAQIIRHRMPRGFGLDPTLVPYCNVNAFAQRGPSACRASRLGSGTLRLSALNASSQRSGGCPGSGGRYQRPSTKRPAFSS